MATFKVTAYDEAGVSRESKARIVDQKLVLLDGDKRQIELKGVGIELLGDDKGVVRLSDPASGVIVTTNNPRLLDEIADCHACVQLSNNARHLRNQMPDAPHRTLHHNLKALGILAAILGGCWLLITGATELAIAQITPEMEQAWFSKFGEGYKLDTPEAHRVAAIGAKLAKSMPNKRYDFQFFVDDSDQINAFCYPGGKIVVLKGMVNKAKSDDELAGVIGHEIGHAIHRDFIKKVAHDVGFDVCVAILMSHSGSTGRAFGKAAEGLEHLKFSREEESQADTTGVDLAYAAGYKADAVADLFDRLKADLGDSRGMAFVSDHPATTDRIAAIRNQAARLTSSKPRK